MNRIIITAIGVDRPGLVNKITSIINQNNGNIENSKMIKIDDQFAIILEFSTIENINGIKESLKAIDDLEIYYKPAKPTKNIEKPISKYLVKGSDDQGIVKTISNYFKGQNLNITELDTFIESAPITGSPLFNLKITVEHNSATNLENVKKDLAQICEQLNLTLG
tara:strand:+ start:1233 stop:1727 length:495 start_codon:yes stop_codon:yes gene_type:complete